MTPRQNELLRYVIAAVDRHGVSPSYAELAEALALRSRSGIVRIVDELVARGLLVREDGRGSRRSLAATPAGYAAVAGTLLGRFTDADLHAELVRRAGGSTGVAARRLAEHRVQP